MKKYNKGDLVKVKKIGLNHKYFNRLYAYEINEKIDFNKIYTVESINEKLGCVNLLGVDVCGIDFEDIIPVSLEEILDRLEPIKIKQEEKTVVETGWKKGNIYSFYISDIELFNVINLIKNLGTTKKQYEVQISLVDGNDRIYVSVQEYEYVVNDFTSNLHQGFCVPTEDKGAKGFCVPVEDRGV